MRIAYFSPLNPQNSGISDYSEELLPWLAELAEIDLFVHGYVPSNPTIRGRFAIYDSDEFEKNQAGRRYDLNLYQMGNNLCHDWIYDTLMRYPGVVVLHEVVLHHFFIELSRHRADPSVYLRELAYSIGPKGAELGLSVLRGEQPPPLFEYPLVARIVDASLGVIAHSQYARGFIGPGAQDRVAIVPAHITTPPLQSSDEGNATREELNLGRDTIIFGVFGHATPAKRIDVVLRAFRALRAHVPNSHLLIVGEVSPSGWLEPLLAELWPDESITLTGPVPFDRFQRFINVCDVGINLRYPTAGETSASALRIMAAGRPIIVSDVGAFSELPDEWCSKISVGTNEGTELLKAMKTLAYDEKIRHLQGQAARSFAKSYHGAASTASGYLDFLNQVYRKS